MIFNLKKHKEKVKDKKTPFCSTVNKRALTKLFVQSYLRGFIVGNNRTSLIDALSVRNITIRSIPMPSPPVGGIPYSSAVQKSSS